MGERRPGTGVEPEPAREQAADDSTERASPARSSGPDQLEGRIGGDPGTQARDRSTDRTADGMARMAGEAGERDRMEVALEPVRVNGADHGEVLAEHSRDRPFCGIRGAHGAGAGSEAKAGCDRRGRRFVLWSCVTSFGIARLDVVVERAAGPGHEGVLEGRIAAVPLRDEALQPVRRRLGHHAAVVEDRDPVAEALGLGQVVRRQDDRRVVGLEQLFDEGLDLELGARVETGGGLVEEQECRARQQRPRDRDLLLHAPAHLLDRPANSLFGDPQPFEDPDGVRSRVFRVQAVEPGRERQVLERRELLEERRVDADAVDRSLDGHLLADEVVTEDLDPTLVEAEEAADKADQRGFAAAVGPEDAVDLSALQAHRDVADGDHRGPLPADVETLGDVVDEEGRGPGARSARRAGCGTANGTEPAGAASDSIGRWCGLRVVVIGGSCGGCIGRLAPGVK